MKRGVLWISFLFLMGFYLYRIAPTITTGDAGELAAVGATLGIGHSPGYPLFSILGKIGSTFLPFANPAYRMTVQSGFWTAGSALLVGLSVMELTGSSVAGLLAFWLLGLCPLWIDQAVTTEVFGLNSCIAAGLLCLVLRQQSLNRALLAIYILAVGLGNNHTLVLLLPAVLIGVVWVTKPNLKITSLLAGLFVIGLSIYVFVPIRAQRLPLMNWEEPATWERFWKLFTRARYGSLQLAQGTLNPMTWDDLVQQFHYVAQVLWENFGVANAVVIIGVLAGHQKMLRIPILLLLVAFVVSGPLFLLQAHLHPTPVTRTILDRFMYLPLVPVAILLGVGTAEVMSWLNQLHVPAVFGTTGVVLALAMTVKPGAWVSERQDFRVWDFGWNLLKSAPPNTLLLADRADEAEFSLAYLQRAEKARPDVRFIDCNAGVSTSIYGPQYYDIWGRPRLAIRTATERDLIRNWNGPVYYATHEPDMIPIVRRQDGILFGVPEKSPKRAVDWDDLLVWRVAHQPMLWDRGLFGDYLSLLAQDAAQAGRPQEAQRLRQRSYAYAQKLPL